VAQAAADAFQERLVRFAAKIIGLGTCLPKTIAGRHIAGQVLRSGTSPAPNCAEARGAGSRADFVHKLRIVVTELNETGMWLLLISKARMAPDALVAGLARENRELARILSASIRTAQAKCLQRPNDKWPLTDDKR